VHTAFCISTAMSALLDDGLRQRIPPHREEKAQVPQAAESDGSTRDHVVWGKTPSGKGAYRTRVFFCSFSDTCPGNRSFSLPRPDDARCLDSALSPLLPKVAHRSPQSRPPCVADIPFLCPTTYTPQDFLLPLFCVLAGCVRCWAGIRPDEAE
jgi:hypothetical protein